MNKGGLAMAEAINGLSDVSPYGLKTKGDKLLFAFRCSRCGQSQAQEIDPSKLLKETIELSCLFAFTTCGSGNSRVFLSLGVTGSYQTEQDVPLGW